MTLSATPSISFLYVTLGDAELAGPIARDLLQRRLAACVNVIGPNRSYYEWEGELCCDEEQVLLVKTTSEAAPAAAARISELHPADLPCVVELPAERAHEPFAAWIRETVQLSRPDTK